MTEKTTKTAKKAIPSVEKSADEPVQEENTLSQITITPPVDTKIKPTTTTENNDLSNQRPLKINQPMIDLSGVLEILPEGYGFLRQKTLLPSAKDVYVSQSQIRRINLRVGDFIEGKARPPKEGEKYFGLVTIESVNGMSPDKSYARPKFRSLTPIFPNKQIKLETTKEIMSTRLLDLVAPIGKGQRGMIVSPPKAGKTWLLKDIAHGIKANNPDIHLIVLLIGERPEEVTDMDRSINGEVVASNFDEAPDVQIKVAEMALERAQRLAEIGRDVVILSDSITRLARAYNLSIPPSGRTLSGGFDPAALYPPKRFFGAARNFEEGGSLTIIATALIDTGSRMDDLIYEEFKGTGNMELHLIRKLAERRVYPAIDILRSGTRREDLLFNPDTLKLVFRMRTMLDTLGNGTDATELLLDRLSKAKDNATFLDSLHQDIQ